jgi:hypothetical protein
MAGEAAFEGDRAQVIGLFFHIALRCKRRRGVRRPVSKRLTPDV